MPGQEVSESSDIQCTAQMGYGMSERRAADASAAPQQFGRCRSHFQRAEQTSRRQSEFAGFRRDRGCHCSGWALVSCGGWERDGRDCCPGRVRWGPVGCARSHLVFVAPFWPHVTGRDENSRSQRLGQCLPPPPAHRPQRDRWRRGAPKQNPCLCPLYVIAPLRVRSQPLPTVMLRVVSRAFSAALLTVGRRRRGVQQ